MVNQDPSLKCPVEMGTGKEAHYPVASAGILSEGQGASKENTGNGSEGYYWSSSCIYLPIRLEEIPVILLWFYLVWV